MAGDAVAFLAHQRPPLPLIADAGGSIEQADGCRRLGQGNVLGPARVVVRQEQFLAVQDRRIEGVGVGAVADGLALQVDEPAFPQGGERFVEEFGVVQQGGEGWPFGVEADQVVMRAALETGDALGRAPAIRPNRIQGGRGVDVEIDARADGFAGSWIHGEAGSARDETPQRRARMRVATASQSTAGVQMAPTDPDAVAGPVVVWVHGFEDVAEGVAAGSAGRVLEMAIKSLKSTIKAFCSIGIYY